MAKVNNTLVEISPNLSASNYAAGDVLFDLEELTALTFRAGSASLLRQLGIFWDINNAPALTLYFFSRKPSQAGYGVANTVPAFNFDDRAALTGILPISTAADTLSYATLHSKQHVLATGNLAFFSGDNKSGWMGAIIDEAYTGDLSDKLKITLNIEKL